MKRHGITALAASFLTTIVLAAPGSAQHDEGTSIYFRGWAIFGTDPYFQVWNPGPGSLCIKSLSVSVNAQSSGVVLLMHEPLLEDISTWDKTQRYNASAPEGISLNTLAVSRGQIRASVGVVHYGGQLWSFRLRTNMPYTIKIDDCLAPKKGLGIRIGAKPGMSIQVHFGARWSE